MKLSRNEKCWCGSGIKYKRCHLDREEAARPTPSDAHEIFRRLQPPPACLHPEASKTACSPKAIQAHTVPKSALRSIAEDGHVLATGPRPGRLTRRRARDFAPELVGIRDASVVEAFCHLHDSRLFEPIDQGWNRFEARHALLLGFRALAREYRGKLGMASLSAELRRFDAGMSVEEQVQFQFDLDRRELGAVAGLDDLRQQYDLYCRALRGDPAVPVHYVLASLSASPELMTSGFSSVEFDFAGNTLQQIDDASMLGKPMDSIAFTMLPNGEMGAAVMTWLGRAPAAEALAESFKAVPDDKKSDALVRFALESSDNCYLKPSWWASRPPAARQALLRRIRSGLDVFKGRESDALCDDGVPLVEWQVVELEVA